MRHCLALSLEFLLYAALTAFMLHATWLTWPDAFIDFSRELYLPWRVSCGDVLYRDLAYYFGPVSVYVNAALFALLGRPSIHALFALNFVFWIATLLALRALLRRIASPLAATLAISSFILLFSFSRYTGLGNDNFLAPYSHEITRGFLFALLSILSLDSALRRLPDAPPFPRFPVRFLFPGFFYALVLFTKPELALATSASLALFFALHAWERRTIFISPLLAFFLAAITTVFLVVTPFAIIFHSISQALHDTLFKLYLDCFNTELSSLPYFKTVLGSDYPLRNAGRLLLGTAFAIAPFFFARILRFLPSCRTLRRIASVILVLASAAIGWGAFFPLNHALSMAPLALFGIFLWKSRRSAHTDMPGNRHLPPSLPPLAAAFAVFASLLTAKIVLNCSVGHYGFVLALPAFCCAALLAFRPPLTALRAGISSALFAGFTGLGLLFGAIHLHGRNWNDITHPVHDAAYLTDPVKARAFNAALDWIRANTSPDSTLAVLPEGAILNVLAERSNPTPYVSLPLTDWLRYDESSLLAAYSNTPPDTLVLVKTTAPCFGFDYAKDFMSFLDSNYETATSVTLSVSSPDTPVSSAPYLLIARKN